MLSEIVLGALRSLVVHFARIGWLVTLPEIDSAADASQMIASSVASLCQNPIQANGWDPAK